jgi:hypothetical protein
MQLESKLENAGKHEADMRVSLCDSLAVLSSEWCPPLHSLQ